MAQILSDQISWKVDVHLLTNRHMLVAFVKIMFGASGIVSLLLAFLLGIQGDWDAILPIAGMLFAIGCGLFLFGLLLMAFPFRNKVETSFLLNADGIKMAITDKTVKLTNRIGMFAGAALGSAATTGSSILSTTQEEQALKWTGNFKAVFEPSTRSIAFVSNWRVLMRVYCLAENYADVVAFVQSHMEKHNTASHVSKKSPIGKYILRTLMVILCCLPLFAMCEVYDISMFLPLLTLCFGIAVVWFVAPLAWVTIATIILIAGASILNAVSERQSYFSGENYQRFEVLSGDDWALTILALIGSAVLIWFSLATINGKIIPAFTQDLIDMGDEDA